MRSHGFRKFFITQCDRSGMSFTVREYLSGHKLPNQDPSYIRTSEEDRLAEYVKAIPFLVIDPNQRLQQENHDLKSVQAKEITMLKEEIERNRQATEHNRAMMEAIKSALDAKSKASYTALKESLGWR